MHLHLRAAELLNAIPEPTIDLDDSQASDPGAYAPTVLIRNADPEEAALEAKEINKYLLAKSLFDCREFDRCAAIFLPDTMLAGVVASKEANSTPKGKGKAKAATTSSRAANAPTLPRLSQRSLFLALYAKFLSGEKRKDEDAEMVMGPQDLGTCVNKQLLTVSRYLEAWFEERKTEDGEDLDSQGWLEYL
jgi:anaphase-promoting complex subunit 8